jgi:thioredoxin 2
MAPAFEAAAAALEPRMRLIKVSTEEAPALAGELAISSIPTLALFVSGREVARQAGAMPAGRIIAWAEAAALPTNGQGARS